MVTTTPRRRPRRRGHHPAAQLDRILFRVPRAGTHRRGRQHDQPGLPQPRGELHPALLAQLRLRVHGELQGLRLPRHGAHADAGIAGPALHLRSDFRSREVSYILRFSRSCAYVCTESFKGFDYPGMVRTLMQELPDLRFICVVDGAGEDGTVSLANELATTPPRPSAERVAMSSNEVFRMAFTSGTIGNPKCVLHSFNTTLPAFRVLTRDMQASENDVFLIYLPVGLNFGYLLLVHALLLGGRAVLLDRFSGRAALELIAREKVTFMGSAPA